MFYRLRTIPIFLITCFVFMSLALAHAKDAMQATVIHMDGSVFIKAPNAQWLPATRGMKVDEKSVIKTSEKATCDISLDKKLKNIVSLGPETEISIEKLNQQVKISKGRVFSIIENLQPNSSFEVRTPVASGAARGTAWETVSDVLAQFNVLEDRIVVQGFDSQGRPLSQKSVSQRQKTDVDQNGKLGPMVPLSLEDIQRLMNWAKRIRDHVREYSEKGKWKDLVDDYDGETPDLFQNILKSEIHISDGKPTDNPKEDHVLHPDDYDSSVPIPGEDITTQTYFSDSTSSGSESQQQPPTER
ncbi:MAG: FecR domain-containing protein [Candidatus Omnitrophota bacterium]